MTCTETAATIAAILRNHQDGMPIPEIAALYLLTQIQVQRVVDTGQLGDNRALAWETIPAGLEGPPLPKTSHPSP